MVFLILFIVNLFFFISWVLLCLLDVIGFYSCLEMKFVNKYVELLGVEWMLYEWKAKVFFVCVKNDSFFLCVSISLFKFIIVNR